MAATAQIAAAVPRLRIAVATAGTVAPLGGCPSERTLAEIRGKPRVASGPRWVRAAAVVAKIGAGTSQKRRVSGVRAATTAARARTVRGGHAAMVRVRAAMASVRVAMATVRVATATVRVATATVRVATAMVRVRAERAVARHVRAPMTEVRGETTTRPREGRVGTTRAIAARRGAMTPAHAVTTTDRRVGTRLGSVVRGVTTTDRRVATTLGRAGRVATSGGVTIAPRRRGARAAKMAGRGRAATTTARGVRAATTTARVETMALADRAGPIQGIVGSRGRAPSSSRPPRPRRPSSAATTIARKRGRSMASPSSSSPPPGTGGVARPRLKRTAASFRFGRVFPVRRRGCGWSTAGKTSRWPDGFRPPTLLRTGSRRCATNTRRAAVVRGCTSTALVKKTVVGQG
jgi:hypothetical protein